MVFLATSRRGYEAYVALDLGAALWVSAGILFLYELRDLGVWQSWHPPNVASSSPRRTSLSVGFGIVVGAGDLSVVLGVLACTALQTVSNPNTDHTHMLFMAIPPCIRDACVRLRTGRVRHAALQQARSRT